MAKSDDFLAHLDEVLRENMGHQIHAVALLPPDWGDNAAEVLDHAMDAKRS